MSFDGIVTGAVVRQLSETLLGGKIEKIYQPEVDEITMHIHAGREKHKLLISAGSSHARIHLSKEADNNPATPTGFCMLLRKHLQGGRIAAVEQIGSERIVEIFVDTLDEMGFSVNRKLIVEIMGKHSNIILTDLADNRVLDSIKRVSIDVNRYRQTLPGIQYVYPPDQEKSCFYTASSEDVKKALESGPAAAKALLKNFQGISPSLADEIVYRAESPCPFSAQDASEESPFSVSNPSSESIFTVMKEMTKELKEQSPAPKVYLNEEKTPADFHIFPITMYRGAYEELASDTISQAIEHYYSGKASSNRLKQKSVDLEKALAANLDKLYLKKQRLSEDLLKAQNSDAYRLCGELLTANLHAIKDGSGKATVLNYYDNTPITITLDPRFSVSKNAQRYFKKYGKAKTAVKEKGVQLEETGRDLLYLESVLSHLQSASSIEEIEAIRQELVEEGYLKKRKTTGKPVRYKAAPLSYRTSDGFLLLVGRNNKENDVLTFQTADRKDIWFHTKDIPGSHVLLVTKGKEATETAIYEAAALAAYHSKGQSSENVPVDYVPIRYVKKPNGAKPGMVIFTNNRTVYVNPQKPESAAKTEGV